MKKRLLLTLMVVANVLVAVACGSDTKEEATTNANDKSTTVETTTGAEEAKACKLVWEVPENFTTEDDMIYVSPDYPTDASNITYTESLDDPTGIDFTKEDYETTLKTLFGEEVELNITKFEKTESNGCDGLIIAIEYELQGIKMAQTQYVYASGDDIYSVTYTVVNDSAYAAAFEESAKSIKMVEVE